MTEREYLQLYHLPAQIERARAKLLKLEERARKYGAYDLLEPRRQA